MGKQHFRSTVYTGTILSKAQDLYGRGIGEAFEGPVMEWKCSGRMFCPTKGPWNFLLPLSLKFHLLPLGARKGPTGYRWIESGLR